MTEVRIVAVAIKHEHYFAALPAPSRHHDLISVIVHGSKEARVGSDAVQGFVTSQGRFVTRKQAWKIANAAGQIIRQSGPRGTLFSEDLW